MSGFSPYNPTTRFNGLGTLYAQFRPTYPEAVLSLVISLCELNSSSLLIDVGCGTGISSRLFAQQGIPTIGIEPNADMRAQAMAKLLPPHLPTPKYQDGSAEATALPDGIADAVIAAQAFHWFEPDAALREFHRVLKPGGWCTLLWNERDESDRFTAAYGDIMRTLADTADLESSRNRSGDFLIRSNLFIHAQKKLFYHQQELDREGLIGRAFSTSYSPRNGPASHNFANALGELFATHEHEGKVIICYETRVYLAKRK